MLGLCIGVVLTALMQSLKKGVETVDAVTYITIQQKVCGEHLTCDDCPLFDSLRGIACREVEQIDSKHAVELAQKWLEGFYKEC